jgi:predicted nucleotidyltransferase
MAAKLNETEANALKGFIYRVVQLLGQDYLYSILFGSKARGEGRPNSDLDVALFVNNLNHLIKREIIDIAYEEFLETGVDISPVVFTRDDFERLRDAGNPLFDEIERDKMML